MKSQGIKKAIDNISNFEFNSENKKLSELIISKYPEGKQRSAVIALLDLAQRQNRGWLTNAAIEYIANLLDVAAIKVYEVASFYSMFNLKPVGKNFIQVCRTSPCWLRGSDKITNACKKKLGIDIGETTSDGKFTLVEVECLGACVNAPVVQINDDYFEDLNEDNFLELLDNLDAGKDVKIGSQTGRQCSSPIDGVNNVS